MLQSFANWLVYGLFGLSAGSHLGEALSFFIYDTTKILLLLALISTVMGIINAYFPVDRLRSYLLSHRLYGLQYVLASVFGAITPFCSCSSVPLFIGFVRGGIPLGVTLSFLITSPLVNEVAMAMFLGTFGWRVTLIYVVSGIVLGIVGGIVLGRMKLERYLSPWVLQLQQQSIAQAAQWQSGHLSFLDRLPSVLRGAWDIVRGVILYVVIGIAIGAAIHGYVPEGWFAEHLSGSHWYGVPLAVLLAVPMYANAAGIVPVVEVLVSKGVAIGTALAFMMAVVGLSLPEATMLKKVMTWPLIAIFFGIIALMIIMLGYGFNWVM